MLTFRIKGLEESFEVTHGEERLVVIARRRAVRRREPVELGFVGPPSFRLGVSAVAGQTWRRVEHADGTLLVRIVYPATSTSSRAIINFDGTDAWRIRWIRPERSPSPQSASLEP